MVSGTWKITVDPPALDQAEVAAIKKSPFTKLVAPGVLPPASGSPPESDEDGADAIRSKGDDVCGSHRGRSVPMADQVVGEVERHYQESRVPRRPRPSSSLTR